MSEKLNNIFAMFCVISKFNNQKIYSSGVLWSDHIKNPGALSETTWFFSEIYKDMKIS